MEHPTEQEYQEQKREGFQRLGKPEFDMGKPINEAAREFLSLKSARAKAGRREKKADELKKLKAAISDEAVEKAKTLPADPIDLDDKDLEGFTQREKDLLQGFFEDMLQSPKTLGQRFGWPTKSVNRFLNSPRVQAIRRRYFLDELGSNMEMALLRLTKAGDARVILAAADYLKVFGNKQEERIEEAIDTRLERFNKLAGDWLAGDMTQPLVIRKEDLI